MSRLGRVDHAAAVEELHEALTARLAAMTTSDDWLSYLSHARKFHRYSPQNQLLLALQGAEGSVAGYRNWQRIPAQGGGTCRVRKGEKGLQILAPLKARSTEIDEVSGEEVTRHFLRGFRTVKVFHQGQLVAPPDIGSDAISPKLLTGESRRHDVWTAVRGMLTKDGFDVALHSRSPMDRWNGQTNYSTRRVLIADDLESAQQLKTLLHEWAHVSLDHEGRTGLPRDVREVEAESVAFLLGQTIGLDTEVYSIPYIAGWSAGDLDLVADTAQQVLATTKQLIDALQRHLGIALVHDPLDHAVTETEAQVAGAAASVGERSERSESLPSAGSTSPLDVSLADATVDPPPAGRREPVLQEVLFDTEDPRPGSALEAADTSDGEFLRALGQELEPEQATEFAEAIYRSDRVGRAAEILAESGRSALQTGRILHRFGVTSDRIRAALEHDVTAAVDRFTGSLYPRSEVDAAMAMIDPEFTPTQSVPEDSLRSEKTNDMKMLQRVVRTTPDARLVVELAEALELEPVNVIRVCESVEAPPTLAVAVAVRVHHGDGAAALATLKRAWPDIDGGWESHAHPSMLTPRPHLTVVPDPPEHDAILDIFAEWDAMNSAIAGPEPAGQPMSP